MWPAAHGMTTYTETCCHCHLVSNLVHGSLVHGSTRLRASHKSAHYCLAILCIAKCAWHFLLCWVVPLCSFVHCKLIATRNQYAPYVRFSPQPADSSITSPISPTKRLPQQQHWLVSLGNVLPGVLSWGSFLRSYWHHTSRHHHIFSTCMSHCWCCQLIAAPSQRHLLPLRCQGCSDNGTLLTLYMV